MSVDAAPRILNTKTFGKTILKSILLPEHQFIIVSDSRKEKNLKSYFIEEYFMVVVDHVLICYDLINISSVLLCNHIDCNAN